MKLNTKHIFILRQPTQPLRQNLSASHTIVTVLNLCLYFVPFELFTILFIDCYCLNYFVYLSCTYKFIFVISIIFARLLCLFAYCLHFFALFFFFPSLQIQTVWVVKAMTTWVPSIHNTQVIISIQFNSFYFHFIFVTIFISYLVAIGLFFIVCGYLGCYALMWFKLKVSNRI